MTLSIYATILPNQNSCGSVCTTEMKRRGRPHPRYGTILLLVEAIQVGDQIYKVDRKQDLDRIRELRPELRNSLTEARLVLEMSVLFRVPQGEQPKDFTWETMVNYLTPRQQFVRSLELNTLYSITLNNFAVLPPKFLSEDGRYENPIETRERFTRIDRTGRFLSCVAKTEAADVAAIEPELDTQDIEYILGFNAKVVSAQASREVLMGFGELSPNESIPANVPVEAMAVSL